MNLVSQSRIGGDPWLPALMPVLENATETSDVFTLTLRPPGDFTFEPGQFNMLYVPGYGEVPISISGDPARPGELVHTVRSVGSVTRALSRLQPGDVVGVRGPYGRGWPNDLLSDRELVLIAGGIGLAPLRPVIYAALAAGATPSRVHIVVGARSPDDLLFGPELALWGRQPKVSCAVTVDRALGEWRGHTGVVTKLIPKLGFAPERVLALLCGPEVMIRFAARELEHCAVPLASVYISAERNMKCALGFCGHCQLGPAFVCRQGPVFTYQESEKWLSVAEL